MLKAKVTTRKFYDKWLYKVTLGVPGVAIFRLHKLEDIPNFNFETKKNPYSTYTKAAINKETIIKLAAFLSKLEPDSWGKRIESGNIDLYTNDKEIYASLIEEFDTSVKVTFEPDVNNLTMLENSGSIVAKKLPHDKYHYKAFLLPHKILDKQEILDYISWIENQGDKILMTDTVKKWFVETSYNWDRRYLLVEDSNTLLMLKLRSASALGRIYDYVISDK